VFFNLGVGVSLKFRHGFVKVIGCRPVFINKLEDISGFLSIKARPHLTSSTCQGTHNSGVLCVCLLEGVGEGGGGNGEGDDKGCLDLL
jgi:hypothetical protein